MYVHAQYNAPRRPQSTYHCGATLLTLRAAGTGLLEALPALLLRVATVGVRRAAATAARYKHMMIAKSGKVLLAQGAYLAPGRYFDDAVATIWAED